MNEYAMTDRLPAAPAAAAAGQATLGLLLGLVLLVALVFVHISLGANLAVLALAAASALVVLALLWARPYDLGSWFAAFVFFQLFGAVWIYKSWLLIPLEDGLLRPVPSMGWGLLLVLAAAGAALASNLGQKQSCALKRYYGDPARWAALGWILFATGELSLFGAHVANYGSQQTMGAFGPFGKFTTAGLVLLANSAARRGRAIDWRIAVVLAFAVVDALLSGAKSTMVFQAGAVLFAVLLAPGPRFKQAALLVACVAALVFADRVIFPAIHVLRAENYRDMSLRDRMTMVDDALSAGVHKWAETAEDDVTIASSNRRFFPSDSLFMRRFSALRYVDTTIAFGEAGSAQLTPAAFLQNCVSKALPGPLSPGKEYFQHADKLWIQMDPNMEGISNETMGCFPSARLIFGEWEGFALTAGVWALTLWIFRFFYGSNLRDPLVQFLIVALFYTMVEGDLETHFITLMRLCWQDIATFAVAGWLVARASRPGAAEPQTLPMPYKLSDEPT
jgi:hypothetical protein